MRLTQKRRFGSSSASYWAPASKAGSAGLYATPRVPYEPGGKEELAMDDKDVRRLEDRIEASNKEAQLRLDAVMARIDGRFETISNTLAELKSGQADLKSDLRTELAETRATARTWGMWAAGTALAAGLGIGGLLIGMKQVWVGGVQVGQAISNTQPAATKP